MENNNNKIKIAVNKTDIQWIRDEISDLKNNHLLSIYKRLGVIEKRAWINNGILTVLVALTLYLVSQ